MRPRARQATTRQVVAAALVLLVVGAIGALQAAEAGYAFMFDLEQVRPALAKAPPTVTEAGTPRLARRVILVIVDGMRLDRSYELPFLDELRRRGVDGEASSHYPSLSRPNYVSILTGVPPVSSGVRTNYHTTPVQLDSLMDRARAHSLVSGSATDYDVLPRLFLRQRGDRPELVRPPVRDDREEMPRDDDEAENDGLEIDGAAPGVRAPDADLVSPFDDARYAPWPGGFTEAGSELIAGNAELVVLLVGAVDAAGHRHGGESDEYRAAAQGVDRALERVLGNVDLGKDAIVITADHGHTARGGHGGIEPEVMSVPLIAVGAGILPGATPVDARLIDVAPTVAALLGMPAPGHGVGRTLVELLAVSPSDQARLIGADHIRLIATRGIVAAAEASAESAVLEHRALRLALVAAGTLVAIGLGISLARRGVLRLDIRSILVTVPVFFVVYYALIGLLGQRFSPSLLPAQGHIATTLLQYGAAAIAVQVIANLWVLRTHTTLAARLANANGIAWLGLAIAMIPAAAVWAVFPPPFVNLPGPFWLVLIPALEVGVACAAVTFALTLAVEVIVFAARIWSVPLLRRDSPDSPDRG